MTEQELQEVRDSLNSGNDIGWYETIRLLEEIIRLRKALEEITDEDKWSGSVGRILDDIQEIARKALEGKE